ncbi:hypothetical protein M0805_002768 [Coniferiporia weirii]|nr:hypothetical protein M0805_002768 [Coniferiporia weirii]
MQNTFDFKKYADYASLRSPETKLPKNTYFGHTEHTLTIFEPYPKAIFHLLMLPRVGARPLVPKNLVNLRTLLNSSEVSKKEARALLETIKADADKVKGEIEQEMINWIGFKWDIWMGFHAAPSLEHLHLHIISSDLCGEGMKKPSHYNGFHPGIGYFLHLDDVLEWFEVVESRYNENKQLSESHYRKKLTEELYCFHKYCLERPPDMRAMKEHLQEEFDKIKKRENERIERRRVANERKERVRKKREQTEAHAEEELEGVAEQDAVPSGH